MTNKETQTETIKEHKHKWVYYDGCLGYERMIIAGKMGTLFKEEGLWISDKKKKKKKLNQRGTESK